MSHPLDDLLQAQKRGEPRGIPSICSAHPWVLKTALQSTDPVLVESTCNQVNQFGGYTGMTPEKFVKFVHKIATQNNFPENKILLGGDHLGPFPWQQEPAASAMSKAAEMVRLYALNGFTKIHLDASMSLGSDPRRPLDPELSARRTAELAESLRNRSRTRLPPRGMSSAPRSPCREGRRNMKTMFKSPR